MKTKEALKVSHEWHQGSMDAAQLAFSAQKKGNEKEAKKLFEMAFDLEKKAAMHLQNVADNEPTRSIYFRSAAWLAFHAEKYLDAERMAAYGLTGNAPDILVVELRDIMEKTIAKLKETMFASAT